MFEEISELWGTSSKCLSRAASSRKAGQRPLCPQALRVT